MADLLARADQRVSIGLEDSKDGSSERQIVVAIDVTDDSLRALKWGINELYRSGDAFHIVHVAKVVEEESEIYHGVCTPCAGDMTYLHAWRWCQAP